MSGYAGFAARHAERLVRSLVAETGLPRARAQAVAQAVLAGAWERGVTFPDGAAYGWLRVAARHCAADPASAWADAADAAVLQAHDTAAALAALPPSERELLRLRYVDGLLPAAIADRLGTTVADVRARLDRARTGAARRIGRRHRLVPYLRPLAVATLAGAAAATFVSTTPAGAPFPSWARALPPHVSSPGTHDPVDAAAHTTPVAQVVDVRLATYTSDGTGPADVLGRPYGHGRRGCGLPRTCLSNDTVGPDEVVVELPSQVGNVTGTHEVVVKQEYVPVGVCGTVPAPSNDIANCVPGRE